MTALARHPAHAHRVAVGTSCGVALWDVRYTRASLLTLALPPTDDQFYPRPPRPPLAGLAYHALSDGAGKAWPREQSCRGRQRRGSFEVRRLLRALCHRPGGAVEPPRRRGHRRPRRRRRHRAARARGAPAPRVAGRRGRPLGRARLVPRHGGRACGAGRDHRDGRVRRASCAHGRGGNSVLTSPPLPWRPLTMAGPASLPSARTPRRPPGWLPCQPGWSRSPRRAPCGPTSWMARWRRIAPSTCGPSTNVRPRANGRGPRPVTHRSPWRPGAFR